MHIQKHRPVQTKIKTKTKTKTKSKSKSKSKSNPKAKPNFYWCLPYETVLIHNLIILAHYFCIATFSLLRQYKTIQTHLNQRLGLT